MNEPQFGNKIRHLLTQGLSLDSATRDRLRAAREKALARQRAEPGGVLAWADNVLGGIEDWGRLSLRIVVPIALLVAGATGLYAWDQKQRIAEIADLDAQLLTDELPIDAYLDRGFDSWLKKRAGEQ